MISQLIEKNPEDKGSNLRRLRPNAFLCARAHCKNGI